MQLRRIRTGLMDLFLLLLLGHLAAAPAVAQWTNAVRFDNGDMAQDLSEALTFRKYPTYEQYQQIMEGFALSHPDICRLDTFGTSQEGRLLLVLKISDQVELDEPEASFMYSSTMHGNEVLGFVLLLRLADTLLSGYGTDPEITALVDHLAIWINPLANPDGSFSNDDNLSLIHAVRFAADGTDLNRDFPDPGRAQPDDTTGRARENRYMMSFMKEHRLTMSANLHTGSEVVNYPWDHDSVPHADESWFRFVSREYADEAMALDPDYMWGWPEVGITNGWAWYEALGTRQDYVNWYLEGREVTLELSNTKLLSSSELEHHWIINRRSLINYMYQCMYGIRGSVTDRASGDPLVARIYVENHDSTYSVVHSSATHGDFYRLLKEGAYDLVVSSPGHYSDTINGVAVTDYQATRLDIQLEPYASSVPSESIYGFRILPNPAVNSFRIEPYGFQGGYLEVSVHSLDGRMVSRHTRPWSGSGIELPCGDLRNGIYLVHCYMNGFSEVHRLMVIH